MNESDLIAIRIFSGQHIGAEIALSVGSYIFGENDACDIILHDSGILPRHAQINVSQSNDIPLVTVTPLDGTVVLNGSKLNQDDSIPAQTPFQLGMTWVAWTDLKQAETSWSLVEDLISHTHEQVSSSEPTHQDTQEQTSKADSNTSEDTVSGTDDKAELQTSAVQKRPFKRIFIGLLLLILLSGLTIGFNTTEKSISKKDAIQKKLHEEGFSNLHVSVHNNIPTIAGKIATDIERGKLVRLTQRLQYPVYLDIHVENDMVQAVKTSLANRSIYPDVFPMPTGDIALFGYVKDAHIEEWAMESVKKDVPDLSLTKGDKPYIYRHFRYAGNIDPVLTEELGKAGLPHVETEYLLGTISIKGMFTTEERSRLDTALANTKKKLNIPIVFDVINLTKQAIHTAKDASPKNAIQNTASAKSSISSLSTAKSLKAVKVSSVTMKPLPFVTLATGERIFIGGVLPGGYILDGISIKELKLRRNGNITIYPLRGSNE